MRKTGTRLTAVILAAVLVFTLLPSLDGAFSADAAWAITGDTIYVNFLSNEASTATRSGTLSVNNSEILDGVTASDFTVKDINSNSMNNVWVSGVNGSNGAYTLTISCEKFMTVSTNYTLKLYYGGTNIGTFTIVATVLGTTVEVTDKTVKLGLDRTVTAVFAASAATTASTLDTIDIITSGPDDATFIAGNFWISVSDDATNNAPMTGVDVTGIGNPYPGASYLTVMSQKSVNVTNAFLWYNDGTTDICVGGIVIDTQIQVTNNATVTLGADRTVNISFLYADNAAAVDYDTIGITTVAGDIVKSFSQNDFTISSSASVNSPAPGVTVASIGNTAPTVTTLTIACLKSVKNFTGYLWYGGFYIGAVLVEVNIAEPIEYSLTVEGGGEGATKNSFYEEKTNVQINAGAKTGYTFNGWTSPDGLIFANSNSKTTAITMPSHNVKVIANWIYTGISTDYKATISADGTSLSTVVTVEGSAATLWDPLSSSLTGVVTAAKNAHKPVVVDFSSLESPCETYKLSGKVIAAVGRSADVGGAAGLTIILPGNLKLEFDASAIAAVFRETEGRDATLTAAVRSGAKAEEKRLLGEQYPVKFIDLALVCKDEAITSFGRGSVKVTLGSVELLAELHTYKVYHNVSGVLSNVEFEFVEFNSSLYDLVFTTTGWSTYILASSDRAAAAVEFEDVAITDWFYDYVMEIYSRGLMDGTSDTTFSPYIPTSRATIVTVLWRLEGQPEPNSLEGFTDLKADWYKKSVNWAAENGIVSGYGEGVFGPEDNITRQQMVSILYRYADYKGYDLSGTNSLKDFRDVSDIDSYALTSMKWAVANALISGVEDGYIAPRGEANRAQLATVLVKFMNSISLKVVENNDTVNPANTNQSSTEQKTVYITSTGECYHYDSHCNSTGTYTATTLEAAQKAGLRPCEKCVLHDYD